MFDMFAAVLKAGSHEPGTVNYPGAIIAPEKVLRRVHMMICCPGQRCIGSTLHRVNFVALGQVHRHLITRSSYEFP